MVPVLVAARRLAFVTMIAAPTVLASSACGGETVAPRDPSTEATPHEGGDGGADRWGTFRSKRFNMVLRLPGGSEWRVDDRSHPELVARHTTTPSKIVAERWTEPEPQNRNTCEARARAKGLVPVSPMKVVEESAGLRSDGEDIHVWVAIEPGASEGAPIRGHAVAVGARARKCWAVHYATLVPSAKDDAELGARLALVREGTLARIEIEGLEEVPRERRERR